MHDFVKAILTSRNVNGAGEIQSKMGEIQCAIRGIAIMICQMQTKISEILFAIPRIQYIPAQDQSAINSEMSSPFNLT